MSVKPLLLSFALTVLVGCGVSAEPAEVAGIDDAPEVDTGPEEPSAALDGLRYLPTRRRPVRATPGAGARLRRPATTTPRFTRRPRTTSG